MKHTGAEDRPSTRAAGGVLEETRTSPSVQEAESGAGLVAAEATQPRRQPLPLRPLKDWNEFWFRPHHLTTAGFFRVLVGFTVLSKLLMLLPVLGDFFSERGMLTLAQSQWVHPLPRICLFDYLPLDCAPAFFGVLLVLALMFTFGWLTRLTTILLFVGLLSIDNRNPWITNSGDRLLTLMLFYGIFSPWGGALSVDRLLALFKGDLSPTPPYGQGWAMRLMQLQICTMYLWSTVIKLRGQSWPAGEAVYWMTRNIERTRWPTPILPNTMIGVNLLNYFTLLVEGFFPFTVWAKRSRPYAIAGGLLLHLGIEQSMTIQIFGPLVMSAYLLFYSGEEVVAGWERLRAKLWDKPKVPVFYDGTCGFCTQSVVVLRAMDVFQRFEIMSALDPSVQKAYPDLDVERADRELLLKTSDGRWLGGFFAIRRILWSLPTTWLLAPLMYVPGVPWLGVRLYRWVADHRYLFKAGSGSCSLALPSRGVREE